MRKKRPAIVRHHLIHLVRSERRKWTSSVLHPENFSPVQSINDLVALLRSRGVRVKASFRNCPDYSVGAWGWWHDALDCIEDAIIASELNDLQSAHEDKIRYMIESHKNDMKYSRLRLTPIKRDFEPFRPTCGFVD